VIQRYWLNLFFVHYYVPVTVNVDQTGGSTRYCPWCQRDVVPILEQGTDICAHIACFIMFWLGWVMMQVLFVIDTVVLIWSITVCYWYVCERKVMKIRAGTVSAVQVSSLKTQSPLLVGCIGVWNWLWHVRWFCLLMGNVTVQQTTLFLGSSAFLLHAGGTNLKSQPRHQQSKHSKCVVFMFLQNVR
jgi:hypothetical protein